MSRRNRANSAKTQCGM